LAKLVNEIIHGSWSMKHWWNRSKQDFRQWNRDM